MSTPDRPLRADAERNRQAIICAASSVFAQHGTDVTLEQVAHAAGVGVGTIYRRFDSTQELVAVVLESKMQRYADRSEQAARDAVDTPWESFRDYVMYVFEQQATDLAFSDLIASPHKATEAFQKESERALRASILLSERAKTAQAIRPDFHHSDLLIFTAATRGVLHSTRRVAPDGWKRFAEYLLAGLQAANSALETPPSPLLVRSVNSHSQELPDY